MPTMTFGATIYIDETLAAHCASDNYSVANRSCSGTDGKAYRDIRSALKASGPGDTINLRDGTITSNAKGHGIEPKAGQTWQAYNDESVTITTGSHKNVFTVYGGDNVTIQNLTLTGGTESGVHALESANLVLRNLDVSGYNTSGVEYNHGILLSDWGPAMRNFLVEACHVHDAAAEMYWSAGIAVGGESSGGTIRNNRVTNTDTGIWLDVNAGDPKLGYTPHLVQGNVVEDIWTVCYHIEQGSSWIMEQNIANGCGLEGIRVRPSRVGMTGHRYYNNTISGAKHALWISNYRGDEVFTDGQFKNNIFMSRHASNPAVSIATPNHRDSTVIFENTCIRNLGGGPGVCWGDASGIFTALCEDPGVSYADTPAGYAAWEASAPNVSGVSTGDSCL
jgi:hypothetical protein